jgi:outer membrane beta-barrel protein
MHEIRTMTLRKLKTVLLLVGTVLLTPASALAQDTPPGPSALTEHRDGKKPDNVVQNRFFTKSGRFEITPILGYVPNNPMVKRYIGGLLGAYHLSEEFAVEGAFLYAPDMGQADLKDLTHTLVGIAEEGTGDAGFRQPFDKMNMGASFAARWAPFYGKINLIGETVLNFDMYGTLGLGMLSLSSYYAQYDEDIPEEPKTNIVLIERKVVLTPNVGLGLNFFATSAVSIKIDGRSYFYVGEKPQYDPDTPVEESRLYNNFVASLGVSIFIPRMKARMFNF